MMTWRERTQAARERGWYTHEDRVAWTDFRVCFVGEAAARYGITWIALDNAVDKTLGKFAGCQAATYAAVHGNDFDRAEEMLDLIEDRALALKREASS